ncbi:MAG: L,D-transpeptidase family protein, partial [Desulfovibrio sp.]|nr:L,D-transpeptidase family protein [Desulfovibrio sp.]
MNAMPDSFFFSAKRYCRSFGRLRAWAAAPLLLMLACAAPRAAELSGADGWQAVISEHPSTPAYLIAVDKSLQRLSFFERRSPLRLSRMFLCSTGQNVGDKKVQGDLKTPEGIYFVVQRIGSGLDFVKYGPEAYTLNYPNPYDRWRKKTGHGIWIHGRGEELTPLQTEGCVSLNNADLSVISKTLVPGAPVALTASLVFSPGTSKEDAADIQALERHVKDWAKAWSDRSPAYFDFYDPEAYSLANEPFSAFRAKKQRLFKVLPWIRTTVRDIQVLRGPGYWVTWFHQDYQAPNLRARGVRRLYWTRDGQGRFAILGMEWQPGLDTSTLLASADPLLPPLEREGAADPSWPAGVVETALQRPAAPNRETDSAEIPADIGQAGLADAAPRRTDDDSPAAGELSDQYDSTTMPRPSERAFALAEARLRKNGGAGAGVQTAGRGVPPLPRRSEDGGGKSSGDIPPLPFQGLQPPAPEEKTRASEVVAALKPSPVASPDTPYPASFAAKQAQASETDRPGAVSVGDIADTVSALVEAWRAAWESGDIDAYMRFYAADARQGQRAGTASIRRQKARLWAARAPAEVRLGDLRIIVRGKGKERMVMADMHQKYADKAGGGDEGLKT